MNLLPAPIVDRLRAGALHLVLSAVVAGLAAALIFRVWYPPPLAAMQGVDQLVILLVAVDVVLGPLLTTIVYRRGKPSLRFDLGVIAALQLAALAYGLATIHAGRPALIVFNVDRFDVVAAGSVDPESAARARTAGLPPLPQFGPEWRVAQLPADLEARNALVFSTLKGGPDLPLLPHLQQPYDAGRDSVRPLLKPLAALRDAYRLDERRWQALLATLAGRDLAQLGWLPAIGKVRDGVVIASTVDGVIVGLRLPVPSPD
jgi:hypothetical protein